MPRQSRWMLVVLVLGLVAVLPGVARADGCGDGGGGSQDISTLEASFDEATDVVTVELELCADADRRTKYRVHFDHTDPFAGDCDRNGDMVCNGDDFCVTTSDDTMMHRGRRDTGPGEIDVDGNVLTYTVWMGELSMALEVGDTIYVWADTHSRGIRDRAPDTDDGDGCGKPEEAGEFVELVLQETGCAAGDRYEDQGDGTVLDCETDLVWLKDASCGALAGTTSIGQGTWDTAQAAAAALADGTCGLSDGSSEGDWRQPTIVEFCSRDAPTPTGGFCPAANASDSLIDFSLGSPFVSNTAGDGVWTEGDPFVGVQSFSYWSATEFDAGSAWSAALNFGNVFLGSMDSDFYYVWPVRGGQ